MYIFILSIIYPFHFFSPLSLRPRNCELEDHLNTNKWMHTCHFTLILKLYTYDFFLKQTIIHLNTEQHNYRIIYIFNKFPHI